MTEVREYLAASTIFISTFLVIRVLTKRKINDGKRHPPSLPSVPVLGSIPFLPNPKEMPEFLTNKANELGHVFTMRLGNHLVVVLNKKDVIHEALVKRSLVFADRPEQYVGAEINPKRGGIVEHPYNAQFCREHNLSISILKEFGFGRGVMETRIHREVEYLIKSFREIKSQPSNPENLITCCVMNVIASILYNTRYQMGDKELEEILHLVHTIVRDTVHINIVNFFPLLRHLPFVRKAINSVVSLQMSMFKILERKMNDGMKDDAEDSFVKRYFQAEGKIFEPEQLKFFLRDLLIAGMETSSTTMRWALIMLVNNPHIQDRLQADIDSVVPRDRLPSLDDKASLPYVEAAILELMRWRTLAPIPIPRKTTSDTEVDGYYIPANSTIFINLYSAHTDSKVFPEPDKYKPERFLDESGHVINRDLMMSFSLGRRACLGEQLARQEIFLFFTGLLQQFHIRPPEGQQRLDDTQVMGVTNAPNEFEVRLIPRDNKLKL